jgi:chromate transporter
MRSPLREIALLFLKLGTFGFGGPATHLALMEDEVVQRRKWLTSEQYVDLIGATNLIPGPNSTEMAIHIGFLRGGAAGLVVAGACFITPAVLITVALAWLYVTHGQLPQVLPAIAGIKPAVLAIIFAAGYRLGRTTIKGTAAGLIAAGVGAASLGQLPEIPVFFGGSAVGTALLLWLRARSSRRGAGGRRAAGLVVGAGVGGSAAVAHAGWLGPLASVAASGPAAATLMQLGLFFLKVGAVLYGTGYVLIAYLQGGLVDQYGWLTEAQLLDAVAVGQLTPGPIVSAATFIGYVIMAPAGGPVWGLAGAAVATAGVFLPSFVFVAVSNPFVPRLRRSRPTAAFLDAVNAASLGLMAAVVLKLAAAVLFPDGLRHAPDWSAALIGAVAAAVLLRWKANAVWLIVGGALAGWGLHWSGVW